MHLNPSQRRAVTAPAGPVLVLAGPGTGKTRVLTERIHHLVVEHGADPGSILALTFTNRAAGEMVARLADRLGRERAEAITAGTFHRFCINVIRPHHEAAGLSAHFSIADETLQRTILYRALPHLTNEESNLNNALRRLQAVRRAIREGTDADLTRGDRELLAAYEKEMTEGHFVDFDDIIHLTHDLFRDHPDILAAYQERYTHFLVDEFQDTDREQYALIDRLAGKSRSLFIVADDRQSIYAWRNADPENIRRFRREWLDGPPIFLNENYRSTGGILDLAQTLIARNPDDSQETIVASKTGTRVTAFAFHDHLAEGRHITADIRARLAADRSLRPGNIAILYPIHAIGAELEGLFMEAGIPCQMAHQRGLFDQPVVQRVMAVLRFALDSANDAGLENFLRRELDAADPAIYPAIRALQRSERYRTFKQAAFRYLEGAPGAERDHAERALGLAGVVTGAVREGGKASLAALVDDILDQLDTNRLPSLKNDIAHLADPASWDGLPEAAARIQNVVCNRGRVFLSADDQVHRAVCADLVRDVFPTLDVVPVGRSERLDLDDGALLVSLDPDDRPSDGPFIRLGTLALARAASPSLALLKLLQLASADDAVPYLPDYVAFDIESTDLDIATAEVVEIGAVKVRGGAPVDTFQSLVRPRGPISQGAAATHGITPAEVETAPDFATVFPAFREFLGGDPLVAHNGYAFDFQVLNSETRRAGFQRLPNTTLDTLPMARSYHPGMRHTVDALCAHYEIPVEGERHRALDDTRFLVDVFEALKRERASRYRRLALEDRLDRVALAMIYEPRTDGRDVTREEAVYYNLGAQRLLEPGNTVISELCETFPRLGGDRIRALVRARLEEEPRPHELAAHSPDRIRRFRDLTAEVAAETASLDAAIRSLLDLADLYRTEGQIGTKDAVHLLTLHAAKGLEFREVYVCGLEERNLPRARAVSGRNPKELEEQRRLLYVGITRAMERLTLTCAQRRRFGRNLEPSRFFEELDLTPEVVTPDESDRVGAPQ